MQTSSVIPAMKFPEGSGRIELQGERGWGLWRVLCLSLAGLMLAIIGVGFYVKAFSFFSVAGAIWVLAVVWIGAGLFGRPLKVAVTVGGLIIRRGGEEVSVPLSSVRTLERWMARNGVVMVTGYFNPPTRFGDVLTVPLGWRPTKEAEAAVEWLQAMIEERRRTMPVGQPSAEGRRLGETAGESGVALVPSLTEDDLDYLADRLPRESALCQAVRRERQRRWYG